MGKRLEYRSTLEVLRPLRQNTVRTTHWWNSIQCIRAGHLVLSAGGLLGTNVSEQGRAGYFPRIQTLLPMHETAKATRDTTEIRRCARRPIIWTRSSICPIPRVVVDITSGVIVVGVVPSTRSHGHLSKNLDCHGCHDRYFD
jgi:hypothetical protein